jgi:hypothetical protein
LRAYLLITYFCFLLSCHAAQSWNSKTDTLPGKADSSIFHHRKTTLAISGGAAYTASMFGLYQLWYKDYPGSGFHFFNDNREWKGIDKAGHATSSYYVGRLGYDAWRWAGMSETKAIWIGGLTGFFHLTIIEIFDGFSAQWGASAGDLAANTLGSALFISQQLGWHQQRAVLKWSYHSTDFPSYRPDLLGRNSVQQMLKDYNGHTYWLSANLRCFAGKESRIPGWLNIAVGYHATGMTGAATNSTVYNEKQIPEFERRSLYYISPDIDLTRIHTHSAVLKWIFETIGFLKFPLPALEISTQGVKFNPIYF